MTTAEASQVISTIAKNRRAQRKIARELFDAFASESTGRDITTLEDGTVSMSFELVAADCKSRRANCFFIGIRGGLRVIKKEW